MTKKIILLLVEGPTDKDTLALIFSKLVKNHNLEFEVLHTDITADEGMTVKYIEQRIQKEVERYLAKNPFIHRKDILKLVQIIDTDGAFIPSTQINQSDNGKTTYFDTHIDAKDKNRLTRRNISKRAIVHHLANAEMIAKFPYEIYYFSRNLEHVLHDLSQELSNDEKEELAFEIAIRYSQKPKEFLRFLYHKTFHINGTYRETWNFIMQNGNSLRRYCNITIFFERLGIPCEDGNSDL